MMKQIKMICKGSFAVYSISNERALHMWRGLKNSSFQCRTLIIMHFCVIYAMMKEKWQQFLITAIDLNNGLLIKNKSLFVQGDFWWFVFCFPIRSPRRNLFINQHTKLCSHHWKPWETIVLPTMWLAYQCRRLVVA